MTDYWKLAFLITLLIEMPIYFLFMKVKASVHEKIFLSFAPTGITHPLLWFLVPWGEYDYSMLVVTGELAVFLIEGLYLKMMRVENPFLIALIANLISCLSSFVF